MFTGITIGALTVVKASKTEQMIKITLKRPPGLFRVQAGDSVAVDGVCLTVEKLKTKEITFSLTEDTLKTTRWTLLSLRNKVMNVELSLKLGGRLGGHFVSGHVDGSAKVKSIRKKGKNTFLVIELPSGFKKFLWKKGYITVNGVSLTIQEVLSKNKIRLSLVPETVKRTNLGRLSSGDFVTFEVCYLTRLWERYFYSLKSSKRG